MRQFTGWEFTLFIATLSPAAQKHFLYCNFNIFKFSIIFQNLEVATKNGVEMLRMIRTQEERLFELEAKLNKVVAGGKISTKKKYSVIRKWLATHIL